MSDLELDALESEFETAGWYAAWQEARQAVKHIAGGKGYSVAGIGWVAWNELGPAQRRDALNQFFTDYYLSVVEEEREQQLQKDAASGTSYIEGWEPYELMRLIGELRDPRGPDHVVLDDETVVTVGAKALLAVLNELDLVQHRLKMRDQ